MAHPLIGLLMIVGGISILAKNAGEKKTAPAPKKELTNTTESVKSEPSIAKTVPTSETAATTDDDSTAAAEKPE